MEKLGIDGPSAVEIRVELGIPASTWRPWIQTHPDFAEAVEEADDAARAALEKIGRLGVKMGPGFNATAYIFLMKNRWPKIYRDRQDHQITGANDGPIVQELRTPDLTSIATMRGRVQRSSRPSARAWPRSALTATGLALKTTCLAPGLPRRAPTAC